MIIFIYADTHTYTIVQQNGCVVNLSCSNNISINRESEITSLGVEALYSSSGAVVIFFFLLHCFFSRKLIDWHH